MRAATGFHPHEARLQLAKEVQHLRSTQCATYDHGSFFGYAMNLKNGFG
jgi:hypothetical protein